MSNKKSQCDIGLRLKEARKALSLTQITFSAPLGIRQSHISGIEKGEREPSETLIILMEYHYGINQEWLRSGKGEMFLRKSGHETDLSPEHQHLMNAYDAAEDSIKKAALLILEDSAAKSNASEMKAKS